MCTPPHTGFNSAFAGAHERNKKEKSPAQKKTAQERKHKRENRHTREQQRGQPKHEDQPAPGDPDQKEKKKGEVSSTIFIRVSFSDSEVLMPRVGDHRVQPRCQYSSYEDHPRDRDALARWRCCFFFETGIENTSCTTTGLTQTAESSGKEHKATTSAPTAARRSKGEGKRLGSCAREQ